MFRGTMYNLADLRTGIAHAFSLATTVDRPLDKALAYFENALLLRDLALRVGFASIHAGMLWALAFLQLWKSITAILGDPSRDKDHQSRYRSIGLPEGYWKGEVEPLYRIRNDEDVAHHTLDFATAGAPAEAFGKAIAVCQRVVQAYSSTLAKSAQAS